MLYLKKMHHNMGSFMYVILFYVRNKMTIVYYDLFYLTGPSGSQPLGNPFAAPDIMQRLEANPKTREYLKQPDYRMMIQLLQQNPNSLQ